MSGPRSSAMVAAAVLALLTLVGCSGAGTTSGADTTTDRRTGSQPTRTTHTTPAADPPEVGECRALTFADISRYADDSPVRSCTGEHTSYTFAVEDLPSDVAFTGVQIQNDAVQAAAAETCTSRFTAYIGGDARTRTLARLTTTYFVADQEDFDRGAHWVRCDVVALQSASSLAPLPRRLEHILDTGKALDDYGVCSDGDPGSADSALVMCTQPHTFRAVTALRLGGSDDPYPGADATRADGESECKDFIADLLGVTGGFTYGWTYPSATDWSGGQRFGYCWNSTDR